MLNNALKTVGSLSHPDHLGQEKLTDTQNAPQMLLMG